LVAAAAGFGVLIMSFIKNTRQAGPVMGGLLAIMGMLGGLFTSTIPNAPTVLDAVSLATPHGWAMRCWKIALNGGTAGDVFSSFAVLASMGALFFVVGVVMFRKRFA
jgi:ABC-type multidrug transport system permease subunit